MNEDRMPTLFEILNRFSKSPVDLWSFYVFLKEQYGGVEYLEFWLDCAAHTALCKNLGREMLKKKQRERQSLATDGNQFTTNQLQSAFDQTTTTRSPSSSEIFNILQDDTLDKSSKHNNSWDSFPDDNQDFLKSEEPANLAASKRMSSVSIERSRNKRHTVSQLSEILDNMTFPEFPKAVATSPTRGSPKRGSPTRASPKEPVISPPIPLRFPEDISQINTGGYRDDIPNPNRTTKNENAPITPSFPDGIVSMGAATQTKNKLKQDSDHDLESGDSHPSVITKKAVRNSALRIIKTYLTPNSPKVIELPINQQGWSMAEELRQLSTIPGGLDNPKLFESSTTYVFEALEREALPAFLLSRALSNVQPVSATLRLICGLLALFGAFWLSFVFILLDWQPKWRRCWIILPFAVGWYLTITSLYHIDPLLALIGFGEKDGGGLSKVQERFVRKMLLKRSLFVLVAIVLLTTAFSVLFIFVPGHRL